MNKEYCLRCGKELNPNDENYPDYCNECWEEV